jgi:hypothetical protein
LTNSGGLGGSLGERLCLDIQGIVEQYLAGAALQDGLASMIAMFHLERRLPSGSRHAMTCFIAGILGFVFANGST